MDRLEWVIDTWVLYAASDFQVSDRAYTSEHFLAMILLKGQHKVAVDNEGKIEAEYKRCFDNPKNEFQHRWWIHINWMANKVVKSYSGNLNKKDVDHLIKRLHFHDDDLPFVGVASKTKDKLLVAEESDYTPKVRDYLKKNLQIRVMSIYEADSFVK